MPRIRQRVFYAGRVQGVGFRVTVKQIALEFPVTGWVRNCADGQVELLAEGEREPLESFLTKIAGTMGVNIQACNRYDEASTGEFAKFVIET